MNQAQFEELMQELSLVLSKTLKMHLKEEVFQFNKQIQVQTLEEKENNLEQQIAENGNNLEEQIEEKANNLDEQIEGQGNNLQEHMEQHNLQPEENLIPKIQNKQQQEDIIDNMEVVKIPEQNLEQYSTNKCIEINACQQILPISQEHEQLQQPLADNMQIKNELNNQQNINWVGIDFYSQDESQHLEGFQSNSNSYKMSNEIYQFKGQQQQIQKSKIQEEDQQYQINQYQIATQALLHQSKLFQKTLDLIYNQLCLKEPIREQKQDQKINKFQNKLYKTQIEDVKSNNGEYEEKDGVWNQKDEKKIQKDKKNEKKYNLRYCLINALPSIDRKNLEYHNKKKNEIKFSALGEVESDLIKCKRCSSKYKRPQHLVNHWKKKHQDEFQKIINYKEDQ